MSQKSYCAIGVLACIAICFSAVLAQNSSPITGQWTIGGFLIQDQVQISIQRRSGNSSMSSSSALPLSRLRGLTRAHLDSAGTLVRFDVVRDAGTLQFQGYLQSGAGGGTFTFIPNSSYAGEMQALGYSGLSDEKIFAMAVHDVSTAYIRAMHAEGIRPESADKLITMRIHNVTIEYVRSLRDLGYSTELTPDKLVTMRIHGVTTDFAGALKSMGYSSVTPDQMVTMRIHGASEDFIKEVQALGYNRPPVNQLVTMRIHGVTPEFIRQTRARGLGNLPIDQLVRLKIHGILD
jgi:hypothetical protein